MNPPFESLLTRLVKENPDWRPSLFGGTEEYPNWFKTEFVRLARPPISRIIKKANVQLRETKEYFKIKSSTGVLLFVNDGFTGLAPDLVFAVACNILMHSYSSVDCFIYLNVNRYVEVQGSNEPKLLWSPTYSDRANDDLVTFIDTLGRNWFDFLAEETGISWTSRTETQDRIVIRNSRAISIPGESHG